MGAGIGIGSACWYRACWALGWWGSFTWPCPQGTRPCAFSRASRAYFSSVAIDDRLRKSPKEKTVTLSNPKGETEEFGVEHSMYELSEIGAIDKLTNRYNAIQKGVI